MDHFHLGIRVVIEPIKERQGGTPFSVKFGNRDYFWVNMIKPILTKINP